MSYRIFVRRFTYVRHVREEDHGILILSICRITRRLWYKPFRDAQMVDSYSAKDTYLTVACRKAADAVSPWIFNV